MAMFMTLSGSLPLLVLAVITILYALFDLFNKRNVPDLFAYASVVVGLAITFVYNSSNLAFSLELAVVIAVVGYLIYRLGLWGAGDYFELLAISLILPLQPAPLLVGGNQLGLPFVLSVFVATGFAAIWIVPIYYLFFIKKTWRMKPDMKHVVYGVALFALYLLLFSAVYFFYGFTLGRLVLILLIAIPSAATLIFEEEITSRMVQRVYPSRLEDGDIIAFNMMDGEERKFFSKYRGFGRLATRGLIARLKNVKKKLPVYKNAAPLAVFILAGVIISLLFGDVVLFII
jgi:hypothetical protein